MGSAYCCISHDKKDNMVTQFELLVDNIENLNEKEIKGNINKDRNIKTPNKISTVTYSNRIKKSKENILETQNNIKPKHKRKKRINKMKEIEPANVENNINNNLEIMNLMKDKKNKINKNMKIKKYKKN